VRVVYPPKDGDVVEELVDVPWDGKTVGEIVTRGNIVMKEVITFFLKPGTFFNNGLVLS
jgi:hypothetical protein